MFTKKLFGVEVLCIVLFLQCAAIEWQAEDSCQNGGESRNGSYPKCSCSPGYKGFDCSQKVSPCEGVPCRNGGKCVENEDGFTCECPEKHGGMLCEKRVRPCDSQPCKNGGNCSDDGLKCRFECECPDGYKGKDCSKKIMPCEVSPCQNRGICSDKKEGGFQCICKDGYAGLVCQRRDGLYTSYILDSKVEYIEQLLQWLDGEHDWGVCYRASRDGWKSRDFHSRCDNKGPTVTIVRVGLYIFGGYTDMPWGGTTGYKKTTKSFLFSLHNKDNLKPFKSPIYRNYEKAIYQDPSYGPTFGTGHDLHIRGDAYKSFGSYADFGPCYKTPTGYMHGEGKTRALLGGIYRFLATEVEVFYLR